MLCVLDERRLKAAGHKAPESFWAAVVPVYLWKRARLLSDKRKIYFFGWLRAFALSLGVETLGGDKAIADAACPVVTKIIKTQYSQGATCVAVTIDDEPKSDFYTGHALLDNGNELRITIQSKGDNIYVTIPNQ